MVAIMAEVVLFVAVKAGTLPLPLAAIPIFISEFVQVNVVPGRLLLKAEAGTFPPAHTVKLAGTVASGRGFTVTVAGFDVTEPQLLLTTTSYDPALGKSTTGMLKLAEVAPLMFTPFFRH